MLVDNRRRASSSTEQSFLSNSSSINDKNHLEVAAGKATIPFSKFFTYIGWQERILLYVGTFSAICAGAILPSIALIMGTVAKLFSGDAVNTLHDMQLLSQYVIMVATSLFIFAYMFFAFWQHMAENITSDLRKRYLRSLLRQEIGYFEVNKVEQIPAQMGEIFETVKHSIGEKTSNLIFAIATCCSGIIYGLILGPTFTLCCLAYLPFLLIILAVFGMMVQKTTLRRLNAIKHLGGLAEETLTAIKVVASFGREEREIQKFGKWSQKTSAVGKGYQSSYAVMVGLMKFSIFFFYTFAFLVGSFFIQYEKENVAYGEPYGMRDVLSVIIALITGFVAMIAALPNVQALVQSKTLGVLIFDVIERQPEIRDREDALKVIKLDDQIKFTNVTFKYPTAMPEHFPVLIRANFSIKAGETTAIVGPSGSGKSTIVQLIERFYDPRPGGFIEFDNIDIKDLSLKSLRERIGYVSQEPVLIMGSVKDNLLYGNVDATDAEINAALEQANATFVHELESGLNTFVGTAGILNMSGGQKQRIAIARALLKKPQILILDEATSALDPKSEIEVQAAINKIANSGLRLTIIIIAHRVTTIETANNLLVFRGRSDLITVSKGTEQYEEVMKKVRNVSSAPVVEESEEDFDGEEIDEEEYEGSETQGFDGENKINASREDTLTYLDNTANIMNKDQTQNPIEQPYALVEDATASLLKPRLSIKDRASFRKERSLQESQIAAKTPPKFEYRDISIKEIMKYYTPRWMAVCGLIASFLAAGQLPIFGYIFANMVFTLNGLQLATEGLDGYDLQTEESNRNFWISMFFILCIGIGLSSGYQKYFFGNGGENLSQALRMELFSAILHKHIGWFDDKEKAPGVLTKTLTEDINQVNGLTTESIGIILEASLGLLLSCLICAIFSWQLAIVCTFASPFMVLGGLGMSKLQFNQGSVDDAYKQANALLSDIIMNYRTVISLGEKNVDYLLAKYGDLLIIPHRTGVKKAHISGLFFGYSQSIRFIFIAFVFYVAALFAQYYNEDTERLFTGVYVIFVGAIGSGVSISQLPSMSKAKSAARQVFGIIEEPSRIDPKQTGQTNIPDGKIEIKNLTFRYPSRNTNVLSNMNLTIHPNQSVAIVGHSGSGKSTVASLLLRFYDPTLGTLNVDEIPLKDYSMPYLREKISVVMQEPLLFNETIKSNILFGNPKATDQRIREVAVMANALGFIQQNDQDLTSKTVQRRLISDFANSVKRPTFQSGQFRNINTIIHLVQDDEHKLSYGALVLIIEIMEHLSIEGFNAIENNFDMFISTISVQAAKADVPWQQILKCFDFQSEKIKILELAQSDKIRPEVSRELKQDLDENECMIDSEMLIAYNQYVIDNKNNSSSLNLNLYIKKEKSRVEAIYETRFKELVDQWKVDAMEQKLHSGFQKICGLRGSKLSGGQKQRIAIARALIKDPKILILDEATSALDERSQEIVQQALDRAMEGRTSIVIAHRMTTIKKCDRIVVLYKGKIVEDGTYKELSSKEGGYFYNLEQGNKF